MKRIQLLEQTQDQKTEQQRSHQVKLDKLQAEADLLATESKVEEMTQKLVTLKSASVLSIPDVIAAKNELEGYKEGLKDIKAIIKELF